MESAVARKLKGRADLFQMPLSKRRREIQLAMMDVPGVDPDNSDLIRRVDEPVGRIYPRFKSLTSMSDDELAVMADKSRPTIQAYIGGRLDEKIDVHTLDEMARVLRQRIAMAEQLAEDIAALRARGGSA